MQSGNKGQADLSPDEKEAALSNIDLALRARLKIGTPRPMSFILSDVVRQGLTLDEIRQEIENETETGRRMARIWSVKLF